MNIGMSNMRTLTAGAILNPALFRSEPQATKNDATHLIQIAGANCRTRAFAQPLFPDGSVQCR